MLGPQRFAGAISNHTPPWIRSMGGRQPSFGVESVGGALKKGLEAHGSRGSFHGDSDWK